MFFCFLLNIILVAREKVISTFQPQHLLPLHLLKDKKEDQILE